MYIRNIIIFNLVNILVFSLKKNLNLYLLNPLLTVKLLLLEIFIVFLTQMLLYLSNDISQTSCQQANHNRH